MHVVRTQSRGLLVAMIGWLLVACGDGGVVNPGTDIQVPDASEDIQSVPDMAASDVASLDTAEEDTMPEGACEPGTGCFGEICEAAEDCLSGVCTMHMGEKVCSKTCDAMCPLGWACTLVGSGGDGQYVCLSQFSHLCLPCSDAGTCSGDTPNACVKYGDGMSFCGGTCDLETPCPSGYSCQEVESTTGAKNYQCVSTAGVCACSNLAIDSGLASPCRVTNDLGTCEGARICEESGLSECTAVEATPEVCNGIDDDCDGMIDEDTCDDGNDCTEDACGGDAGCQHTPLEGGECLDGDSCTMGDHCESGVCVGTPIDCDDGNLCTKDSCDGIGGCTNDPIAMVCDDGDACTAGDICSDGVCKGTVTLSCDDGNPCTDDSCGDTGCVFSPNAEACDDGNACTSADTCSGGQCSGNAIACDDGNLCTTDSCDMVSGCVYEANSQPCDDGDICTLSDICADGACAAGLKILTCDDGNSCTDDGCQADLGCIFTPNNDACDDNNSCTTDDVCTAGNCTGLGSLACDDGNPCTVDSCETDGGCSHTIAAGACDDGDACTLNDACINGSCTSGTPVTCDDGNPCTQEVCDGGDCVFTPTEGDCDDSNSCTVESVCSNGACVGTKALDCDDGQVCTTDGCDPSTGCINVNNQNPCSDGTVCTVGDTCAEGACVAGQAALACDDGNLCTDDGCDPDLGCTHTYNEADCDDGNACTTGDICANGWCTAPDTLDCNDGELCTDDACDPATGCVYANNTVVCDDADACTTGEACSDGACVGGLSVSCSDDNPCTDDSCDAVAGCLSTPNNAPCNDGVGCTEDDVCSEGVCAGVACEDKGLICDNSQCVAVICGDGVCDVANGENFGECPQDCMPAVWLESDEVRFFPIKYPHSTYKQSLAVQVCKDAGLRLWRDESGPSDSPDWVYDITGAHNLGGHDIGYKVDAATKNEQQHHTGEWKLFGAEWAESMKSVTGASNGQDVYILNKQAHGGDFEDTASWTRVTPQAASVTYQEGHYSNTAGGMTYALVLCAERK